MANIGIIEQEFEDITQELDIEAFWKENALCRTFTVDKPRCSLSFSPDDHWIFEFMHVPSTLRYYQDKVYRDELHKQVNEITAKYVGKTFFDEDTWEHQPKRIENLFKCEFSYREGSTPWLTPVTDDPEELARILDKAKRIDLRTWSFPEAYLEEWERRWRQSMSRTSVVWLSRSYRARRAPCARARGSRAGSCRRRACRSLR